jgi:hypothetical protein
MSFAPPSGLKVVVHARGVLMTDVRRQIMGNEGGSDLPKLSAPARRALSGAGYSSLEQLARAKEVDLRRLHGMGPTAIDALRKALNERGLKFRT